MMPGLDSTFCFRDPTSEQLLIAGNKASEILQGLPEHDSFHQDLRSDLAEAVAMLTQLLKQSAAPVLTSPRDELGHERHLLHSALMQTIRAGCRHPFAAKAEAARRLCQILERRGLDLPPDGQEDQTVTLDLLFADFDQAPVQMDLAALDLVTWYQKLKTLHSQYRDVTKEEPGSRESPSAQQPSLHEAKQRLSGLLGMIRQGIGHQARKGRSPYDGLAANLEEALRGTDLVSMRRPHSQERGKSAIPEAAALSS